MKFPKFAWAAMALYLFQQDALSLGNVKSTSKAHAKGHFAKKY